MRRARVQEGELNDSSDNRMRLARCVRDACIRAARQGYEDAAMSGLCEEGALEAALSAIQMLDLRAAIDAAEEAAR